MKKSQKVAALLLSGLLLVSAAIEILNVFLL